MIMIYYASVFEMYIYIYIYIYIHIYFLSMLLTLVAYKDNNEGGIDKSEIKFEIKYINVI